MKELLSSKIVLVEEEPSVRGIPSLPTAVAGAVGLTERGPIDEAVLCTSFESFVQVFGTFVPNSDLALAAMGFFENGGSRLYAVRTVHHLDPHNRASLTATRALAFLTAAGAPTPARVAGTEPAAWNLPDGATLTVLVDGGVEQTATFQGTAARVLTSAEPFALGEGAELRLRLGSDLIQSVLFHPPSEDPMTADEVAAAINAQLSGGKAEVTGDAIAISCDLLGLRSRLELVGGDALGLLGLVPGLSLGSGNVQNLAAVTQAEVLDLVAVELVGVRAEYNLQGSVDLRTLSTGASSTLQVSGSAAAVLGFSSEPANGSELGVAQVLRLEGKDPGSYANRLEVEVRAAASGDPWAFDLLVLDDGIVVERFANLAMDTGYPSHVETVLNDPRTGSLVLRAIDLRVPEAPLPEPQTVGLSGGDDGLAGLEVPDFIGSSSAKTGLHALDAVEEISLLLVPGWSSAPAIAHEMLRCCEVVRDGLAFAVLDPPWNCSARDCCNHVEGNGLSGLTECAAIYWPWPMVRNPDKTCFGPAEQLAVPPSGIVCGVFARTDAARPGGVYDSPAGIDKGKLFGVLGFQNAEVLEEAVRDLIYPKRINPLTTGPGLPRFIDGSRTLKGDGNFPYVAERRGVSFIERSLKQGLQFARHKNNTEGLRSQVRRTIITFLLTQLSNGAFRSTEPKKAFFVDVSDALNTPSVIFSGKLIARVGLATNKPAEFIILRISQDTRALEAEIAV